MKYDTESIAKYLWIALIAVVIIVIVVVIFEPGKDARSSCTGFQYFIFLSQKLTPDTYEIEILNGPRDILVNGFSLDGKDLGVQNVDVEAGDSFILRSLADPTGAKPDENFRYRAVISYDIASGIADNRDSAVCTGKVQ
jgi:hypothetical protein